MSTRTPKEVIETVNTIGAGKIAMSSGKKGSYPRFVLLTLLAGMYISFGGALSVILGFGFPEISSANPGLQKLLSGAAFPVGLILVVVLGAELFTGNNAFLMPQWMRKGCTTWDVVVNWTVVYFGNFLGALFFVYCLVYLTGLFSPEPYHSAIIKVAKAKVSLPWLTAFTRGIGANWCVCLAIWLALSAKSSGAKMFGCWLPVMAFVALGYEHSVANMFFIPAAMCEGAEIGVVQMVTANLVPVTLGHIIGGALFVGCVHTYLHLER